jgi:hypothetical protein
MDKHGVALELELDVLLLALALRRPVTLSASDSGGRLLLCRQLSIDNISYIKYWLTAPLSRATPCGRQTD